MALWMRRGRIGSSSMPRQCYFVLGCASAAVGVVGVVVPLLPTTPLLLVSAWAFSRSSPRLQGYLETHPRLGAPLRAWRRERAIPRRAKQLAVLSLGVGWGATSAVVGGLAVPAVTGAVVLGAGAYILSRPLPAAEALRGGHDGRTADS